jgi:hypothetical protein
MAAALIRGKTVVKNLKDFREVVTKIDEKTAKNQADSLIEDPVLKVHV